MSFLKEKGNTHLQQQRPMAPGALNQVKPILTDWHNVILSWGVLQKETALRSTTTSKRRRRVMAWTISENSSVS